MPHSDTRGSKIALISPRLFAKCCVLLRLLVPRHPPNALVFLFIQYVYTIPIAYTHQIPYPFTPLLQRKAKYGFFRISIKLFSRLPGANARCFISAYTISMMQAFVFSKDLKEPYFHTILRAFLFTFPNISSSLTER